MFAKIDAAASGPNVLVSGISGKTIRVLSYVLVAAGAVTATWKSGSTAKSGDMSLITGVPLPAPAGPLLVANRAAWLETDSGEDLVLTLNGTVQVSGHLEYELRTL